MESIEKEDVTRVKLPFPTKKIKRFKDIKEDVLTAAFNGQVFKLVNYYEEYVLTTTEKEQVFRLLCYDTFKNTPLDEEVFDFVTEKTMKLSEKLSDCKVIRYVGENFLANPDWKKSGAGMESWILKKKFDESQKYWKEYEEKESQKKTVKLKK